MPLHSGTPVLRHTTLRWAAGGAAAVAIICWAVAPYWHFSPPSVTKDILVAAAFAATAAALHGEPQQRGNARLLWLVAALYVAGSVGGHNVGPLPLIESLVTPIVFLPL